MSDTVLVNGGNDYIVVANSFETHVIAASIQGPPGGQGPPGPQGSPGPSGGISVTMSAQGPIGGNRLIAADASGKAVYADNTNTLHYGRVIGITLNAAVDGGSLSIATSGDVTEPSWNWSPGALYASTNGLLTQTPPSTGFLQIVGVAIEPTRIVVNINNPIKLI